MKYLSLCIHESLLALADIIKTSVLLPEQNVCMIFGIQRIREGFQCRGVFPGW